jgi:predicted nucleotidyltransferase
MRAFSPTPNIVKIEGMVSSDLLQAHRGAILRAAAAAGARNVRVFGSMVRGTADADSDVDFLAELEPGRSLLDLGGLQMELQRLLGRPVDLVTERGLRDSLRARVLREAVPL